MGLGYCSTADIVGRFAVPETVAVDVDSAAAGFLWRAPPAVVVPGGPDVATPGGPPEGAAELGVGIGGVDEVAVRRKPESGTLTGAG